MHNKDIDVVVHNACEETFSELLRLYSARNNIFRMLQTIDEISFVDNGEFLQSSRALMDSSTPIFSLQLIFNTIKIS